MRELRLSVSMLFLLGAALLPACGASGDDATKPATGRSEQPAAPTTTAAATLQSPRGSATLESPRSPGMAPTAAIPGSREKGTLTFGVYPSDSPLEMHRQFLPLCEYLTRATGWTVELFVSPDYASGLNKIRAGEVDLFRSGSAAYGRLRLEAKDKAPVLVAVERLGDRKETKFLGAVVVAKDAPFQTLADLKGRRFAFGDKYSTMGTIVPRRMLREAGVFDALASLQHLPSHDDVAQAVLNGQFDAGACKKPTADKFLEKGLRILALTREVPSKPVYARWDLDPAVVAAVRAALVALDSETPEHLAILKGIEKDLRGYGDGSPEDYEALARFFGDESEEPVPTGLARVPGR